MPPLEENLDLLLRRLHGLASRRPGFAVTLFGEAGIGKSFTARALLPRVSCATFSGHATQSLSSVLLALPRPKKCPVSLERTLERLQNGETLEQNVVQETLRNLLCSLAPCVLYLEDLHECTAEQLELWSTLASSLLHVRGVALLSSSRVTPPKTFEVLALERLSPLQSRALLEGDIHTVLPPEACAWIYAKAAGNPLFTLEFFRSLARQGFAYSDGQRWHWRVPPNDLVPVSVEAMIERVLLEATHLPETQNSETQQALEALALIPEGSPELLCAVSSLERSSLESAILHLTARGILLRSSFAHPLYREMTLKNLSLERRKILSRRALEALKELDAEAAARWVEDAELEPEYALEVLNKAASSAKERRDLGTAGVFMARAAGFAYGEERGMLALEGSVLLEGSSVAESLRLAELAVQELPGHLAAILLLAGKLVAQSRRVADAEPLLAPLPEAVQHGPEANKARLGFHVVCGDFRGALEVWEKLNPASLDAGSSYYAAASLAQTGRFVEAADVVTTALEAPDLPPQIKVRLLNVMGMAQTFLGNLEAAEKAQQEAIMLAREKRLYLILAATLQNYALNLERTERYFERLAAARESVEAYLRVGEHKRAMNAQLIVAASIHEFGDYPGAEALLLECWDALRGSDPSAFLLAVECALIKLYLEWNHAPARLLAEKFAAHALRDAHILTDKVQVTAYAYARSALVEARWGSAVRASEHALKSAQIAENASNQLEFIVEAALACTLEAQGKMEEARFRFAQAAELALDKGFALDAQIYALEGDRLTANLESARKRLAWFETRDLHHGANLVRRYFSELASSEPARTTDPALRLEALGPLLLEGQSVRGGKRQELLKLLLEARILGKSDVSTLELLDTLYPAENEEPATTALKQTVFKTRSSYGPGIIVTTSGGYALGAVSSDAEEFLHSGNTHLWRGVYCPLEGSGAGLETLVLALKSGVARLLERDPQEAARGARILCEMEPYDLESLKLLCSALKTGGNYKSLSRDYAKGRTRLLEVGEILPQTWADFLGTFVPAHSS